MSLDVYLLLPGPERLGEAVERIFVRRDGATVEISREEWDELHPGRGPVVMRDEVDERVVYDANITHNLGRMAAAAGIYEALWRPQEIDATHARDLIPLLRDGLARLRSEPERFEQFNPENGWGDYDSLVRFTANYLEACERWPEAEVKASG